MSCEDSSKAAYDFYTMFCQNIFVIFLLIVTQKLCCACDRAEYEKGGECCPMCSPGTRVYRHCTEFTRTSCVPCIGSTFINKPNNFITCFPCTVCDQGLGVKTVKACTASSDTVCGVLEGNYCVDPYEGGCRAAEKHTTCKPGQFIKHPGTEYTDTVCEGCPDNSYSNGSSTACTPHTDCEANKLPTVRIGDRTSDTQCGDKSRHRKYKHHKGAPSKNGISDKKYSCQPCQEEAVTKILTSVQKTDV
ncbi:tumor necrosis factor receptor superfamily member 5-like isoform X1 [Arapaima gigas]